MALSATPQIFHADHPRVINNLWGEADVASEGRAGWRDMTGNGSDFFRLPVITGWDYSSSPILLCLPSRVRRTIEKGHSVRSMDARARLLSYHRGRRH